MRRSQQVSEASDKCLRNLDSYFHYASLINKTFHADDVEFMRQVTVAAVEGLEAQLPGRVFVVDTPAYLRTVGTEQHAGVSLSYKVVSADDDPNTVAARLMWFMAGKAAENTGLNVFLYCAYLPGDCKDGRIIRHRMMTRLNWLEGIPA